MDDLKENVKQIISILDVIITEDDLTVYQRLKESYMTALSLLNHNENLSQLKLEIKANIRMLMEAPPKDKELGLKLIYLMDDFHKKLANR
ncbi:MAG: hypothetical protein MI810_01385 [Flavobacteriales bacterium]|nr:hypothetical protein [Flavobacteriales bacterium]